MKAHQPSNECVALRVCIRPFPYAGLIATMTERKTKFPQLLNKWVNNRAGPDTKEKVYFFLKKVKPPPPAQPTSLDMPKLSPSITALSRWEQ